MTATNLISMALGSALAVATVLLLAMGEPSRALLVGLAALVSSALADGPAEANG